jgi:predicted nucleic acid-binding protein
MGRTNIELDDRLIEQAMRLTGARTKREVVDIALRRLVEKGTLYRARRLLVALPVIPPTIECHVRAAHLFRSLRRKGITLRGAVDCVIAQVCLDLDAELLSPDTDFKRIASHAPLRLWSD